MSRLLTICIFALYAIVCLTDAAPYSKYGRTCKDIGCLNNEICVMVEDPCGPGQSECGKYPTCKPSNSVTCETYACPPGQQCTMGDSGPKCVTPHHQGTTYVKPSHSDGGSNTDSHRPSNGGSLYPSLYPSGTTSRPAYPGAANYPSQGYAGGSVGSGYPGTRGGSGYPGGSVGSGYPGGSVGSGYPGGYPSGGYAGQYPNQGYPQGGYPQGGYPQGGYPQGGYGYNNHGQSSYPGYGSQPGGSRYGSSGSSSSSSGTSFTDQIAEGLKAAAGNYLKNALSKAIQGKR